MDPADMEWATQQLWLLAGIVVLFFLIRPELWQRAFVDRIDPRPAALCRIAVGLTTLWAFGALLNFSDVLFTDEGMFLPEMARSRHGDVLRTEWDPEHGLRHWGVLWKILGSRWSVLHFRSDPTTVYSIYIALFVTATLMTVGKWTRIMSFLTWLLMRQLYGYTPIFFSGADTVLQCVLFVGVFMPWGEAYSLDSWKRRRQEILSGANDGAFPALRNVAPWPSRMMMVQMTIIYCATGMLKSGPTWAAQGTALYYAMNLDHFYRMPLTGLVQIGQDTRILMLMTWVVHWWEMLFPFALLGVALNRWQDEKREGTWPDVPLWRRVMSWALLVSMLVIGLAIGMMVVKYYWEPEIAPAWLPSDTQSAAWVLAAMVGAVPFLLVGVWQVEQRRAPEAFDTWRYSVLGRRLWLTMGVAMHLGICVLMNVGLFVPVMLAMYPAWLSAKEVDALWWFLGTRRAMPGEAGRPTRARAMSALMIVPDAFRFRVARPQLTVLHGSQVISIRRAALLRCWDLCQRLGYEQVDNGEDEVLAVRLAGGAVVKGIPAAAALAAVLPGLWWLSPSLLPAGDPLHPPVYRRLIGALASKILVQRVEPAK